MIMTADFVRTAVEQQMSQGESLILRVTGRSMRPYLRGTGNESVVVSGYSPEELKPGIIILFTYNGSLVFHRIVRTDNERLIVQGDGNCLESENVEIQNVLGIVRRIIRANEKASSPYSFSGRVYWHIWYRLRPIRKYLLLIYNQLQR